MPSFRAPPSKAAASQQAKPTEGDEYDLHDEYDEPDEDDGFEFECGAWINGKFDFYSCQLAGTEDCDWECPHSAAARGLKK